MSSFEVTRTPTKGYERIYLANTDKPNVILVTTVGTPETLLIGMSRLNKKQVEDLVEHLVAWLNTGSLALEDSSNAVS